QRASPIDVAHGTFCEGFRAISFMETLMRPSLPVGNPDHSSQQPRYGYLSPKQAAKFTSISVQELERLRRVGRGPDFCAVAPRLIRYPVEELCRWLNSYRVSNTAQAFSQRRAAERGREVARG